MGPPTFHGSQKSKASPKESQPVAKMHSKIMENYRSYKKALVMAQEQAGLSATRSFMNTMSSNRTQA
jgi:hypothetical protein